MGQKCVKGSDTPWITFKCNFVNIKRSNNIDMDFTDGDEDSKNNEITGENNCRCLPWLHRQKKEKETMETSP
jgi:hypothetical protein